MFSTGMKLLQNIVSDVDDMCKGCVRVAEDSGEVSGRGYKGAKPGKPNRVTESALMDQTLVASWRAAQVTNPIPRELLRRLNRSHMPPQRVIG
jgi:hypothetical protein